MKVAVTGSSGFIGSALCAYLPGREIMVTGIDRVQPGAMHTPEPVRHCNFYQHDILDPTGLISLFERESFDCVIHLAAAVGSGQSFRNASDVYKVNILGTQHVIDAAVSTGVGTIILGSSYTVYGETASGIYREDQSDCAPKTPYGLSKFTAEQIGRLTAERHPVCVAVLRIFPVYGPGQDPDVSIYRFMDRIYRGRPVSVFEKGQIVRDFIYIDDLVRAIYLSLFLRTSYDVLNIGSGQGVTTAALISVIERRVGKKTRVNFEQTPPGFIMGGRADITKARDRLGFDPEVSLSNGIEKLFLLYLKIKGIEYARHQ